MVSVAETALLHVWSFDCLFKTFVWCSLFIIRSQYTLLYIAGLCRWLVLRRQWKETNYCQVGWWQLPWYISSNLDAMLGGWGLGYQGCNLIWMITLSQNMQCIFWGGGGAPRGGLGAHEWYKTALSHNWWGRGEGFPASSSTPLSSSLTFECFLRSVNLSPQVEKKLTLKRDSGFFLHNVVS